MNVTVFWKKGLWTCIQFKMRSIGWAQIQRWLVFSQEGKRHKRRISCDDRGREQHEAAAGWEISKVNEYHQELGRSSEGLDPQSLRGSMTLLTPWARTRHLWIYDRMNEFPFFAISQFVVLCYYGHVGNEYQSSQKFLKKTLGHMSQYGDHFRQSPYLLCFLEYFSAPHTYQKVLFL